MWIAEAEGVGREEFATEDEAKTAARALGAKGFHWEMADNERGEA